MRGSRALRARIAGCAFLLAVASSPALAETVWSDEGWTVLTVARAGAVTELSGYVGQSLPDSVRLYWDRSLIRYWDIPRGDIVQHIAGNNPNDAVKIYVRPSATITFANRVPAETAAVQRVIVDGLGNIPIEGEPLPGVRPRANLACLSHGALCVAGHELNCGAAFVCLGSMQR